MHIILYDLFSFLFKHRKQQTEHRFYAEIVTDITTLIGLIYRNHMSSSHQKQAKNICFHQAIQGNISPLVLYNNNLPTQVWMHKTSLFFLTCQWQTQKDGGLVYVCYWYRICLFLRFFN